MPWSTVFLVVALLATAAFAIRVVRMGVEQFVIIAAIVGVVYVASLLGKLDKDA